VLSLLVLANVTQCGWPGPWQVLLLLVMANIAQGGYRRLVWLRVAKTTNIFQGHEGYSSLYSMREIRRIQGGIFFSLSSRHRV